MLGNITLRLIFNQLYIFNIGLKQKTRKARLLWNQGCAFFSLAEIGGFVASGSEASIARGDLTEKAIKKHCSSVTAEKAVRVWNTQQTKVCFNPPKNKKYAIPFITKPTGAYDFLLAERGGFEPPVLSHTRFPSVHIRPLWHLSIFFILSHKKVFCNGFIKFFTLKMKCLFKSTLLRFLGKHLSF